MINRVSVKATLCRVHHLPFSFICLEPKCASSSLLCSRCVKFEHTHYEAVLTLEEFEGHMKKFVDKAKETIEDDQYSFKVTELIKQKKQEVEKMQLSFMEMMMKRLAEEKKKVFQALETIEKAYLEREQCYINNLMMRNEIIRYLDPFAKKTELLDLKIATASSWGVSELKECLITLEKLLKAFGKKDLASLKQTVLKQINANSANDFFMSCKELLKEPLRFQPPPQSLSRKYSFRSRQSSESTMRPFSSRSSKPGSFQNGQQIKVRSSMMI